MKLDLSPLESTVSQLGESLELYRSDIVRQLHRLKAAREALPVIRNQMRAGAMHRLKAAREALQAFEFTYGLCVRMLERYLEQVSANPAEVDELSFRNLIRRAGQEGLLRSELDTWMRYRANCGTTSHTYNDERAERVFQGIPEFLEEARHLLKELQKKNELLD